MDYRTFAQTFTKAPRIVHHNGLNARCLEALINSGGSIYIEDLGSSAWGYLEHCGWQDRLPDGDALHPDGQVQAAWLDALGEASKLLAQEGGRQGPSGDASLWLSWMFLSISSAADLRRHWKAQGQTTLTVRD
jgi:hypothetical protein